MKYLVLLSIVIVLSTKVKSQEIDSTFFTEDFIVQFTELAIKDNKNKEVRKVKKWSTDIAIYIENDSFPDLRLELDTIIKELEPYLNGLKISIVKDKGESNFIVSLVEGYAAGSTYWVWWDADFNIYKGLLALDLDLHFNKKERNTILKELFVYSLGNMTKSENVPNESIFFHRYSINKNLTKKDLDYITFLYSDIVKIGMKEKDLKKLIRK